MHLLLALSLTVGAPTLPGFIDAPRLVALCTETGEGFESARSLCLGYVVGALDELLVRQSATGIRTVCLPADLTARQALTQVMHQAAIVEAGKGVSAASFVQFALEQAYPCDPGRDAPWRSPKNWYRISRRNLS